MENTQQLQQPQNKLASTNIHTSFPLMVILLLFLIDYDNSSIISKQSIF